LQEIISEFLKRSDFLFWVLITQDSYQINLPKELNLRKVFYDCSKRYRKKILFTFASYRMFRKNPISDGRIKKMQA
jgi:hypothetical protein